MMKRALILSGGGITGGIYQLGALAALDDLIVGGKRSIDFDIYVGISAGSILSSMLANGITPKLMYRSILGPTYHPLYMREEDIYSYPYKSSLKGLFHYLRSLPSIIRTLKEDERKVSVTNLFSALQSFLPGGIYTNENIERYMKRLLTYQNNTNDFKRLKKELYIIATELDRGERWVFGEEGKRDIPISKAIQASSAIPGFFSPVMINGHYFIDGAAERAGHVDIAINEGASLVFVINPVVPVFNDRTIVSIPNFMGCCRSIGETGIFNVMEQSGRINARVKLALGLNFLRKENPSVDIVLIEPGQMESALFLYGSMNYSEKIQILNYGYNSASIFFLENFDSLNERCRKHGMEISLNNLQIDKFLYYTTRIKSRKRFSLQL